MPLTSQTHEHRGACTSSPPLRVIGVVDGVWAVLKARAVVQGLQIGVLGIGVVAGIIEEPLGRRFDRVKMKLG